MKTEQLKNLLNKYYNGETTLEEEKILKDGFAEVGELSPEADFFSFFSEESKAPPGLEESMSTAIQNLKGKKRLLTRRIVTVTSIAASLIVCITVFLNIRENRNRKLEEKFLVMEQAMYRVSETIKPEEPQEMLVLWVDDNVEIIIN